MFSVPLARNEMPTVVGCLPPFAVTSAVKHVRGTLRPAIFCDNETSFDILVPTPDTYPKPHRRGQLDCRVLRTGTISFRARFSGMWIEFALDAQLAPTSEHTAFGHLRPIFNCLAAIDISFPASLLIGWRKLSLQEGLGSPVFTEAIVELLHRSNPHCWL